SGPGRAAAISPSGTARAGPWPRPPERTEVRPRWRLLARWPSARSSRRIQQDFDAAIDAGIGIVGPLELAVGEARHTDDTRLLQPAAHEHVIGGLGARRRKPPVVVVAAGEGTRVGVAVDRHLAPVLGERPADLLHGEHQ